MLLDPSWPNTVMDLLLNPGVKLAVTLRGAAGRFTAPKRWDTGEHTLEEDLLYGVVRGQVHGHIQEQPIDAKAGALIWCAAGHTFRFRLGSPDSVRLLRIAVGFQVPPAPSARAHPQRESVVVPECRETHPLIDRLVDEAMHPDDHTSLRARGLLLEMVALVKRAYTAPPRSRNLTSVQRQVIEEYVDEHLTEWPALGELADAVGLSLDYFARVFRAQYGMSPQAWIIRQRINMARLLLSETNQTISEIAQQLGYNDVFYFSKQFKRVTGQSPSRYRRS